jgi:hypothetical protein
MADPFEIFQKFNDLRLATAIADKLQEARIEFLIESKPSYVPSIIIGTSSEPPIILKVKASDFRRANQVLEDYHQPDLDDVDPDYYLWSFTSKELVDVITNPDKWGHFDRALAKKIIAEH